VSSILQVQKKKMKKRSKRPAKKNKRRLRGQGPEYIVQSTTVQEESDIQQLGSGFLALSLFIQSAVRVICKITNARSEWVQPPSNWWKEFVRSSAQPHRYHQRTKLLSLKEWSSIGKTWVLLMAYSCAQCRRVQQQFEMQFEAQKKAAEKLAKRFKRLGATCTDALKQSQSLRSAPGMWRSYASKREFLLRRIMSAVDKGNAGCAASLSKRRRNSLHASIDAALLRSMLIGCGGPKPVMAIEPMLTWYQLAEEAGGLHPRSVGTLTKAAESFDERTRPSTSIARHVFTMSHNYLTVSFGLVLWVLLTIAFRFLFLHYVGGRSWNELLSAYRFWEGRLWSIAVLVVAGAPFLFLRWLAPRVGNSR
jgi:hypothetical protein